MRSDNEYLYVQYCYNSVIEFVYFIILYIESYGFISLPTLAKHVKFFKSEVGRFILCFNGDSLDEKLVQMLIRINVFEISGNVVKGVNLESYKSSIFDDLVLSKTVDLALKGFINIKDVCRNLNLNNVISINETNLLSILQRSPCFSVQNQSLKLLHFHGILGFDCNCSEVVIKYFQDVLHYTHTLSLVEIEHHGKAISYCGINGTLPVLCVLHCSRSFQFENGMIKLNNMFVEIPEKQTINLKEVGNGVSTKSLPVGKIVYHVYGSSIRNWTGEICSLTKDSGFIYCVVDFTNDDQGIFKVYFNKSALKIISEIFNLKKCFKIRDTVEFDAEYGDSKRLDNYWKATRIKLLNSNLPQYDEPCLKTMEEKSEIQRKLCTYGCCVENRNNLCTMDFKISDSDAINTNIENMEIATYEAEGEIFENNTKIYNEVSNFRKFDENMGVRNKKGPISCLEGILNFMFLDYSFMFATIIMLMKDKGIAVGKKGDTTYKILFHRETLYPCNESSNLFKKGTKILATIPYIEEIDAVVVASFVYGLSNEELEGKITNPKKFAKSVLRRISTDIQQDTSCNVNCMPSFQSECFVSCFNQLDYLSGSFRSITNPIDSMSFKTGLQRIYKKLKKSNGKVTKNGIISFAVKLAKLFKSKPNKFQVLSKKKWQQNIPKLIERTTTPESDLELNSHAVNFDSEVDENFKEDCSASNLSLCVEYESLEVKNGSSSSLSSYKSCTSTNSAERFQFCESVKDFIDKNRQPSSFEENNCDEIKWDEEPEKTEQPKSAGNASSFINNFKQKPKLKSCKKSYIRKMRMTSSPHLNYRSYKNKCLPRSNNVTVSKPNFKDSFNKSFKTILAHIVFISQTFVFVYAIINSIKVVLPFPVALFPKNAQDYVKLKSSCEIVVVPNDVINLSHILSINFSVHNENK